MIINDFQAELGVAIADLERIKGLILEVFTWGGRTGMIRSEELTHMMMTIELARVAMPIIDGHLVRALNQMGSNTTSRLTFEYPKPDDRMNAPDQSGTT